MITEKRFRGHAKFLNMSADYDVFTDLIKVLAAHPTTSGLKVRFPANPRWALDGLKFNVLNLHGTLSIDVTIIGGGTIATCAALNGVPVFFGRDASNNLAWISGSQRAIGFAGKPL